MAPKHPRDPQRWIPGLIDARGDERLDAMLDTVTEESDRGTAALAAEILNTELEALIRAACVDDEESVKKVVDPLFRGYAPLATFNARIQLAYALQMIPRELFRQLEAVRKLRNEFVHEPGPLSFDDPACLAQLRRVIGADDLIPPSTSPAQREIAETARKQVPTMFARLMFILRIIEMSTSISTAREKIEEGLPSVE